MNHLIEQALEEFYDKVLRRKVFQVHYKGTVIGTTKWSGAPTWLRTSTREEIFKNLVKERNLKRLVTV